MQNETITNRIASFIEKCHAHDLKVTPQRVAIYRELIQSTQHPTADRMYQAIRKTFPNISFDTVNRTLLTFARIGVVDVVETFGGPKRFDSDVDDHHHLHCTACGRIIDFTYEAYANLEIPDSIAGRFTVTGKRVVLRGLCNACSHSR